MTSEPACHFPIQNSLFKNIFGHKIFICQLIFKIFTAQFTTNLGLDIGKKYFASCQTDKNIPSEVPVYKEQDWKTGLCSASTS